MPSRFKRPDVFTWSRERFAALLAVLVLVCGWMAASGARGHATLRQAHYRNLALWHSKSPVPYLAPITSTRHLPPAGARGEPPLVLVRADSVADAGSLCGLAETGNRPDDGPPIVWIALSPAVEPCIPHSKGSVVRFSGASADTLRAEIREARWLVLDRSSRVLYSRRSAPSADELRGVVSLLSAAPARASSSHTTTEPGA